MDKPKLVRMANQIAANLNYGGDETEVAKRVADHFRRFWDPLMRKELFEYASQTKQLCNPARVAIHELEAPRSKSPP